VFQKEKAKENTLSFFENQNGFLIVPVPWLGMSEKVIENVWCFCRGDFE
jgi:hypothetical protein